MEQKWEWPPVRRAPKGKQLRVRIEVVNSKGLLSTFHFKCLHLNTIILAFHITKGQRVKKVFKNSAQECCWSFVSWNILSLHLPAVISSGWSKVTWIFNIFYCLLVNYNLFPIFIHKIIISPAELLKIQVRIKLATNNFILKIIIFNKVCIFKQDPKNIPDWNNLLKHFHFFLLLEYSWTRLLFFKRH